MKEAVRLAIGGPSEVGARASAALADLMASSGVLVSRTGSIVLEWPNARLPLDPHAWTSERSPEADPIAFAARRLQTPAGPGWEAPVDAVRERVAGWLREETLRVTPPWPACAVALVHEAQARRRGLRRALSRGTGLETYERLAAIERAHGAASALERIDLLEPEEQAQVRALGFALDTPDGLIVAAAPGFRRGTAFPTRIEGGVEIPLLAEDGIEPLLAAGGGAGLRVPVAELADDEAADRYDALLSRLRAAGAWLTTPTELARALYA